MGGDLTAEAVVPFVEEGGRYSTFFLDEGLSDAASFVSGAEFVVGGGAATRCLAYLELDL